MEDKREYNPFTYYCPVFDGQVSEYDCEEISYGAVYGRFVNDGLPYLMSIEDVIDKKELCLKCELNVRY